MAASGASEAFSWLVALGVVAEGVTQSSDSEMTVLGSRRLDVGGAAWPTLLNAASPPWVVPLGLGRSGAGINPGRGINLARGGHRDVGTTRPAISGRNRRPSIADRGRITSSPMCTLIYPDWVDKRLHRSPGRLRAGGWILISRIGGARPSSDRS